MKGCVCFFAVAVVAAMATEPMANIVYIYG